MCTHAVIIGSKIENKQSTLIKWFVRAGGDRRLYVAREILEGSASFSERK